MAQRPPHRPSGFVATGPGFYVWEESRGEAARAARDLSPPRPGAVRVQPAHPKLRPGRPRRSGG